MRRVEVAAVTILLAPISGGEPADAGLSRDRAEWNRADAGRAAGALNAEDRELIRELDLLESFDESQNLDLLRDLSR